MSYRYKSALLSLASLVLIYGWYFAAFVADRFSGAHGHEPERLLGTVVLVIIVQIVGHIVIAATSADRRAPMDERERAFDQMATSAGYHVLIVGALCAAVTLHLGASPREMADAIMLAIVVAECGRQLVFLVRHHKAA